VKGQVEVVAVLLEAGAAIDAKDLSGATALDEALRFNHRPVVELLTARGAALSKEKQLRDAVLKGQTETVGLLLGLGADPKPVLHDAALKGHVAVVRLLLEHGAVVDGRSAAGSTALADAALAGQVEVVRLLLEKGAKVDLRDEESGSTALHIAAGWGRTEVVRVLLEKGADARLKNGAGRTALELARAANYPETAALLE